jgi:predicted peptidase
MPSTTTIESLQDHAKETLTAQVFQDAEGNALNYRLHVPTSSNPGEKFPLILFFHGAGERGSDNVRHLNHCVPSILNYVERHRQPTIIIAPQCPEEKQWVDTPWSDDAHTMPEESSVQMRLAIELLQHSISDLPVDRSRIYVAGISMGGFGTWDILQRHPEIFAAAIPVCGGGDLEKASHIKSIPLWAFHGSDDLVVKTIRSQTMLAALKEAGGSPNYTEYPEVGHDSWTETFANDEVLDWLFAQRK